MAYKYLLRRLPLPQPILDSIGRRNVSLPTPARPTPAGSPVEQGGIASNAKPTEIDMVEQIKARDFRVRYCVPERNRFHYKKNPILHYIGTLYV